MEVLYKIKNPTLLIAGSDDSDAASPHTLCCSIPLLNTTGLKGPPYK